MHTIILASQSPRRRQLLEWAEIPFEVQVSDTDESFPPHLDFEAAAIFIALQKALKIQATHPGKTILAADTIVVCNGKMLGKPADAAEAIEFLQMLQNNTHQVTTGVAILQGNTQHSFADTTIVEFHPLSLAQIEFYVTNYKPYDKAGAYAIQEWIGVTGIKAIQGDFYNVMGLPVSRVVQALHALQEK